MCLFLKSPLNNQHETKGVCCRDKEFDALSILEIRKKKRSIC